MINTDTFEERNKVEILYVEKINMQYLKKEKHNKKKQKKKLFKIKT